MMAKSLYNFYLEDDMKLQAQQKLLRMCGTQSKGQLAALLRILLAQFVHTPDNKTNPLLIEAIEAEYTYSQIKNKRSRL